MIKETKLNGFSAIPLEYEVVDGDLSTALGVVSEDGSLKPMLEPKVIMTFSKPSLKVVHIHETSAFHYYIVHDTETGDVYYTEQEQQREPMLNLLYKFGTTKLCSFSSIGNVLIVITENRMYYFLWKSKSDGYLSLGTHMPECPISFGLQTEVVRTDAFTIEYDGTSYEDLFKEFTDKNKTKITGQVLAKVNKFIAEEATNKGRFIFPFFVRYAYRLYDGSLVMHSAPVLMIASSGIAPTVSAELYGKVDRTYTLANLRIIGALSRLDYAVIEQRSIAELENWKDIIRSVDIFISAPIYTYDQNGKCSRFKKESDMKSYCVCKHINQNVDLQGEKYSLRYQKHTIGQLYTFTFGDPSKPLTEWPSLKYCLAIPERSADEVSGDIRDASRFFLIKSVKIDELNCKRTVIDIGKDYLQSLLNREVLTDDYDSHDILVPKYTFPYNSRLNIANIRKQLFKGFNAGALFCYTDDFVDYNNDGTAIQQGTVSFKVYVAIKQDGKDIVVCGDSCKLSANASTIFLYYPNTNAYKAYIYKQGYITYTYEVPLQPHPFLNGAYYFGGWEDMEPTGAYTPVESPMADRIVEVPNKIYTSQVNNPFFFPTTGINTIGTGKILGICAAVKALSQGQFGQFPLYAFSTDGVWALEVSSTGGYSAKQPITREICINSESITQMDSAVLFTTNRGIMLLSGSQVTCISDSINNPTPLLIPSLPKIEYVKEVYISERSKMQAKLLDSLDIIPFVEYLSSCSMLFDYTHQRIVVYNPEQAYAYVYALKTHQWGMILCNISATVNSYPESLAMDADANLVNFSATEATKSAVLLITRAFKLDNPDVLKTIDTLIVRGTFRRGHIKTVLYGSKNLFDWHLVSDSSDQYLRGFRGTPYRFFCLVMVGYLENGESISSFSTQYTPRYTNRLR